MWIRNWTTRAACRGISDPNELFVEGAAQNRAKLICRGCPVRTECLADALDNGIEFGVWGGMTERERRALLRRRPDVTSWHELLERARDRYELQGIDELVAAGGSDPPSRCRPPSEPRLTMPSLTRPPLPAPPLTMPPLPAPSTALVVPATSSVDPAPEGPTEEEIRQRCDKAYKPLLIFLALTGRSYFEARAMAHLVLSEAYQRSASDDFSGLQLLQIAQLRLKRRQSSEPLPPAARPAFPDGVSLASQRLLALVASLPKPQRLVLAWAANGYSPAAIATGTAHPLEAVLEALALGRAALKHALIDDLRGRAAEEDDEMGDADLDAILMDVVDELADAVEEADISAATAAIMADARLGWSPLRPADKGDLRATG